MTQTVEFSFEEEQITVEELGSLQTYIESLEQTEGRKELLKAIERVTMCYRMAKQCNKI